MYKIVFRNCSAFRLNTIKCVFCQIKFFIYVFKAKTVMKIQISCFNMFEIVFDKINRFLKRATNDHLYSLERELLVSLGKVIYIVKEHSSSFLIFMFVIYNP
jgi:hypothetical protein